MNAANALTLSRLLATPFVLALMYGSSAILRYSALALFIAAMLTDVFDGRLARKSGPTPLGTFLDPVADKTLILAVLLVLGGLGIIPLWMGLVMMFREFWVSAIRTTGSMNGKIIGANWMGKSKTFLQVILIVWALWYHARLATPISPAEAERLFIVVFAGVVTFLALIYAAVFTYWHRSLFGAVRKRA